MSIPPSGGEAFRHAQNGHPPADLLELYCLGRLEDADCASLEEHLLICASCQDQVAELDVFVTSFRAAASAPPPQARSDPTGWSWRPVLNWALPAVAAIAITAFYSVDPLKLPARGAEQTVILESLRGARLGAKAGANRPLRLVVPAEDMSGTVEGRLVDSSGAEIWRGPGEIAGTKLTLQVADGIEPGRVWLRIFAPAGELRREYALDVERQ